MKFQVDSDKLFPALYIINLDNTVKSSIVRIRYFPLCEFSPPPVLFYVAKTYVYVFICFYITMHGITKFFTFSVFGHQDIVSKVCRVPDSAGMPVGFSVTLFLIVSVHCFYVSTAK